MLIEAYSLSCANTVLFAAICMQIMKSLFHELACPFWQSLQDIMLLPRRLSDPVYARF